MSLEQAHGSRPRPLISVVIPAYNGAMTIAETIKSVQAQTYDNLEILVVDDGSTDDTAAIAFETAKSDARIKVIQQPNGGVAAARNRGIAEAEGELVALVDTDDLWADDKLVKQWQALEAAGEKTALVYTWFFVINEAGTVIEEESGYRPVQAGDVLGAICEGNFIANGSSTLIRKSALLTVGGYDPSMRARSASGAEDHLLYFRIAKIAHFAVVPEYLTYYRWLDTGLSINVRAMLRSWEIVAEEVRRDCPQHAARLQPGLANLLAWLHKRAMRARRYDAAAFCLWQLMRVRPRRAAGVLVRGLFRPAWKVAGKSRL